jgi:predicted dehydrogenase
MMGDLEPIRIGLMGYGSGGRWFHAPLLASSDECSFLGVVTTSKARRDLVLVEHPTVRVFEGLADLAAAGAEAVTISTPVSTHTALTEEALELGLHVVCDKPFALDAAAVQHTVDLARERARIVVPYQNRRWDSDFLTVRNLLEAGRLGTVVQLESRFERYAPDSGPGAAGGGVLLDFGSHLVDQALVLFGPVLGVYCEFRERETGRDDDVFVALTHVDGVRSHLWGSYSEHAPGLRFRVTGTGATYIVDGPMDGQEPALVRGASPADTGTSSAAAWPSSCRRFRVRGRASTRHSLVPYAASAIRRSRRPKP